MAQPQPFELPDFHDVQEALAKGSYRDPNHPLQRYAQLDFSNLTTNRGLKLLCKRHFGHQGVSWMNEPANKLLMVGLVQVQFFHPDFTPQMDNVRKRGDLVADYNRLMASEVDKRLFVQKFPLPSSFLFSKIFENGRLKRRPLEAAMLACIWCYHVERGTPLRFPEFNTRQYQTHQLCVDKFVACLIAIAYSKGWQIDHVIGAEEKIYGWSDMPGKRRLYNETHAMLSYLLELRNLQNASNALAARTSNLVLDELVKTFSLRHVLDNLKGRMAKGIFTVGWFNKYRALKGNHEAHQMVSGKIFFSNYYVINLLYGGLRAADDGKQRMRSLNTGFLVEKGYPQNTYNNNNFRFQPRLEGMTFRDPYCVYGEEEDDNQDDGNESE